MVALFAFTIRQIVSRRKIWFTLLLLVLPAGLTFLIRRFEPMQTLRDRWELYHAPVNFFLYMLVIPLVSMLHGTALIGSDAEDGTLAYLLTRRLRRSTVLLTKYLATLVVLGLLASAAVLVQYAAALGGVDVDALQAAADPPWRPVAELASYVCVAPMAVAAYLAVFAVIGLLASKPMIISILYLVIVELFVANLPLGVRAYSLAHHVRIVLLDSVPGLIRLYGDVAEIVEGGVPPGYVGFVVLGLIIGLLLIVACLLVSHRELVPAKVARE